MFQGEYSPLVIGLKPAIFYFSGLCCEGHKSEYYTAHFINILEIKIGRSSIYTFTTTGKFSARFDFVVVDKNGTICQFANLKVLLERDYLITN